MGADGGRFGANGRGRWLKLQAAAPAPRSELGRSGAKTQTPGSFCNLSIFVDPFIWRFGPYPLQSGPEFALRKRI